MPDGVIAIIDDSPLVRESVQRLVMSIGFRVDEFSSVSDFFESDCSRTAQCIISDVHHGDTAGLLRAQLASLGRDVPIVFMTGIADRERNAALMTAGAVCVLMKPFHAAELEQAIGAALARLDQS